MPQIPYRPGDGTLQHVEVSYIDEFPKNENHRCAFCDGDPLGENSGDDSLIVQFFARCPMEETCPMCKGKASRPPKR